MEIRTVCNDADVEIANTDNRNIDESIFYSLTELIFELSGEIACSCVRRIGETICLTKHRVCRNFADKSYNTQDFSVPV